MSPTGKRISRACQPLARRPRARAVPDRVEDQRRRGRPGQPPFTALIDWSGPRLNLHWDNYALLFGDGLYLDSYLASLRLAGIATAIALVIALPLAHAMTRVPERWRTAVLVLAVLPFWTSSLIRIYAWIGILGPQGVLNTILLSIAAIDEPLPGTQAPISASCRASSTATCPTCSCRSMPAWCASIPR